MKNLLKNILQQILIFGLLAVSTIGVFLPLFKLERLKAHTEASPLNNVFILGIIVLIGIALPQLILIIMSYANKVKRAQYEKAQYGLAMAIILCARFFSIPSGNELSPEQIDAALSLIFGFMLLQYLGLAMYAIVSIGRFVSKKISKAEPGLLDIPAGFWDRIWAKFIDLLPITIAGVLLFAFLEHFLPAWIILCVFFLLSGLRYTDSLTSRSQATRGKRTAGIYVARLEDRRPIAKPQAWLRFLIMYCPLLLLLLSEASYLDASIHQPSEQGSPDAKQEDSANSEKAKEDALHEHMVEAYYLFMMASIVCTKNKRGFHDRICKTRVLSGKPDAAIEDQPQPAAAKLFSRLFSTRKSPKPQPETPLSGTYAGILPRLGSKLLSAIIFLLMYVVIDVLMSHLLPYSPYRLLGSVSLSLLMYGAYYVGWLVSGKQATPEKQALKLYVVNANGQKISVIQALLRFLSSDFLVLLPFWINASAGLGVNLDLLLGLLMISELFYFVVMFSMILRRADKRGPHDLIAKSFVMRGKPDAAATGSLSPSPAFNSLSLDTHSEHKQRNIAIALLVVIALGYFLYPSSHTETAHKGTAQNNAEARRLAQWRSDAEAGNAKAQTMMGNVYYRGNYGGVEKDLAQAVAWYNKAAAQGNPIAERSLGNMYQTGDGVGKNTAEALKWLRQAADQSDVIAEAQLGYIYYVGDGTTKNLTESLQWTQKAAAAGYSSAQSMLANMYFKGDGTPKDDAQAVAWWNAAAEQDNKEAACNLSHAYENGVGGLPKDFVQLYKWFLISTSKGASCYDDISAVIAPMTPEQREEALRLAHEWKPHPHVLQ